MYIELKNIREIRWGGDTFQVPSNILRYIEFSKTVVLLLDYNEETKEAAKIIGVKYGVRSGINGFFIEWEFKVKDFSNREYSIVSMIKTVYGNEEVICCNAWGFDIAYYLNQNTGEVLHSEPIK